MVLTSGCSQAYGSYWELTLFSRAIGSNCYFSAVSDNTFIAEKLIGMLAKVNKLVCSECAGEVFLNERDSVRKCVE